MPAPTVSICIPAYNGAPWIEQALESALSQTYDNLEVLVVDNGSTDGTPDLVQRRAHKALRLEHFHGTTGAVPNHNRCVELARGRLLKFLHHDDLLERDCVERMAAVFEAHRNVGLVFAPRRILLDDPDDPSAVSWEQEYRTLHHRFGPLETVNDGRDLLARYLPALRGPVFYNWIGEPSTAMVSREAFARVGLFNLRLVQAFDLEMWLRIMAAYDVGFIDEPLSTFRHHSSALTATVGRESTDWLDLLWLYEGLLAGGDLTPTEQDLVKRLRRRERLRLIKRTAGRLLRLNLDFRALADYVSGSARKPAVRQPPIHGTLS